MAEIGKGVNPGKLASNVQKRITRAQEKVMQKLGKADETKDTAFEEEVANFNKQLTEGTKLQRDLKAYLVAVKTMHECSKRLHDCLADIYDPEWFGKEEVDSLVEDTDLLWQDFHQKLVDNALISMDTYLAQFPDIKNRIAKRERKLVDFDSARHHFASIQKAKKKDEAKIAKAEEDLGRAQKVFEEINYELQEELPTLWNSRVGFYVNTFQSVAGLEEKFHRDMGKLNQNLSDIMTKLDEQRLAKKGVKATSPGKSEAEPNHNLSESGSEIPKSPLKSREGPPVPRPPRPTSSQEVIEDNIINLSEETLVSDTNVTTPSQLNGPVVSCLLDIDLDVLQAIAAAPAHQKPAADSSQQWGSDDEAPVQPYEAPNWDDDVTPGEPPHEPPSWDKQEVVSEQPSWDYETAASAQPEWDGGVERWGVEGSQVEHEPDADANWGSATAQTWEAESKQPQWEEPQSNEAPTVTNGSSDAELPPSVLYKVKAMHDYGATDNDELDLKAGDIVLVIPFANPDDQDDGWLMGVKETHWLQNKNLLAKGVFPENFTQKL